MKLKYVAEIIDNSNGTYIFSERKKGKWRIAIDPNTKNEEILWGTLKKCKKPKITSKK